jgi:hypothetical protein
MFCIFSFRVYFTCIWEMRIFASPSGFRDPIVVSLRVSHHTFLFSYTLYSLFFLVASQFNFELIGGGKKNPEGVIFSSTSLKALVHPPVQCLLITPETNRCRPQRYHCLYDMLLVGVGMSLDF